MTDDDNCKIIRMTEWLLEDLRQRAEQRGVTVTELIRQDVALARLLFEDPGNRVMLYRSDGEVLEIASIRKGESMSHRHGGDR